MASSFLLSAVLFVSIFSSRAIQISIPSLEYPTWTDALFSPKTIVAATNSLTIFVNGTILEDCSMATTNSPIWLSQISNLFIIGTDQNAIIDCQGTGRALTLVVETSFSTIPNIAINGIHFKGGFSNISSSSSHDNYEAAVILMVLRDGDSFPSFSIANCTFSENRAFVITSSPPSASTTTTTTTTTSSLVAIHSFLSSHNNVTLSFQNVVFRNNTLLLFTNSSSSSLSTTIISLVSISTMSFLDGASISLQRCKFMENTVATLLPPPPSPALTIRSAFALLINVMFGTLSPQQEEQIKATGDGILISNSAISIGDDQTSFVRNIVSTSLINLAAKAALTNSTSLSLASNNATFLQNLIAFYYGTTSNYTLSPQSLVPSPFLLATDNGLVIATISDVVSGNSSVQIACSGSSFVENSGIAAAASLILFSPIYFTLVTLGVNSFFSSNIATTAPDLPVFGAVLSLTLAEMVHSRCDTGSNSIFLNNTGGTLGGVIFVATSQSENARMNLTATIPCIFSQIVVAENSLFADNIISAFAEGGAIFFGISSSGGAIQSTEVSSGSSNQPIITFEIDVARNASFVGHCCAVNGGVIFLSTASTPLSYTSIHVGTDATFHSNFAPSFRNADGTGGAIVVQFDSSLSNFILSVARNAVVASNYASIGGIGGAISIAFQSSSIQTAFIEVARGAQVLGNRVGIPPELSSSPTSYLGQIFAKMDIPPQPVTNMVKSQVESNGGAIAIVFGIDSGPSALFQGDFKSNVVVEIGSNASFVNNSCGFDSFSSSSSLVGGSSSGGAIYVNLFSRVQAVENETIVTPCILSSILRANDRFSCLAVDEGGGGAAIDDKWNRNDSLPLLIIGEDADFQGNFATTGGALFITTKLNGTVTRKSRVNTTTLTDPPSLIQLQLLNNARVMNNSIGALFVQGFSMSSSSSSSSSLDNNNNNSTVTVFSTGSLTNSPLLLLLSVRGASFVGNTGSSAIFLVLPEDVANTFECQECIVANIAEALPSSNPNCGFGPLVSCSSMNSKVQNAFVPFLHRSKVNIDSSQFVENSGAVSGGAVFTTNGNIEISNVTFRRNLAVTEGGGVWIGGSAQVVFKGLVAFAGNIAASSTAAAISATGSVQFHGQVVIYAAPALSLSCRQEGGDNGVCRASNSSSSSSFPDSTLSQFFAFTLQRVGTVLFDNKASSRLQIICPAGYSLVDSSLGVSRTYFSLWSNQMLTSNVEIACSPCPGGQFSLSAGQITMNSTLTSAAATIDGEIRNIKCKQCLFGANCSLGSDRILVNSNFWAEIIALPSDVEEDFVVGRGKSGDGAVKKKGVGNQRFLRAATKDDARATTTTATSLALIVASCPLGYCCDLSQGCLLENQCVDGRDPAIPLCGNCLPGYSQDLMRPECVRTEDCTDGKWVWPVLVILIFLWVFFLLFTSNIEDALSSITSEVDENLDISLSEEEKSGEKSGNRRHHRRKMVTSWCAPSIFFFYQNIYLLYEAAGIDISAFGNLVIGATNLRLQSHMGASSDSDNNHPWYRMCTIPDITTVQSIALHYLPPFLVGGTMFLFLILVLVSARSKFSLVPLCRRYSSCGIKLVLLFYTTFVSVTGTLLHCVNLFGLRRPSLSRLIIFKAGNVECYQGWQIALWFLFGVVLVPLPLVLAGCQYYFTKPTTLSIEISVSQARRTEITTTTTVTSPPLRQLFRIALIPRIREIATPYNKDCWYWAAFTLFRRLIVSIIFAFARDASVQSLLFAVSFVLFLWLQVRFTPFRTMSGNVVETIGMLCLALTSLCALRSASFVEAGIDVPSASAAAQVSENLIVFQSILFFTPIVVAALLLLGEFLWIRNSKEENNNSNKIWRRIGNHFFEEGEEDSRGRNRSGLEMRSLAGGGDC